MNNKVALICMPMRDMTLAAINGNLDEITKILTDRGFSVLRPYLSDGYESPITALSKSIELMDSADIIVFTYDYRMARGCRVQFQIATEYGKEIMILPKLSDLEELLK